ncbi:MAG: SusC/RagA family TonB-linked outer membrane protein [Bacteroidales bacterium]|nr:SusC/RagA family TonB-linked outer membrane protein [Bacteroidales bacterium]
MKMNKIFSAMRTLLVGAFLLAGSSLFAQNVAKGVIKGDDGEPLIGASVLIDGTTTGTVTDVNGAFTLPGVRDGQTLKIDCLGYAGQTVVFNGQPINISLASDATLLDDVVVTALGMKRSTKALGYAMTEIKADDLNPNLISPISALQGKVAGVEINASDGGMFGHNKILIRGASTLGKNNQPIFVVDGIILDNETADASADWDSTFSDYGNSLKNLNPDDFETVSILKGAAATALYGSRGLNGAIVITTKSGKGTKGLGVSLTQTFGIDQVTSQPTFQNVFMEGLFSYYGLYFGCKSAYDVHHMNVWKDGTDNIPSLYKILNEIGGNGCSFGNRFDEYEQIEWYDGNLIPSKAYENNFKEAYNLGFNTNTNVTVSGGNERSSIYASLSEKYATGTLPNNSFNRFSTLIKASHKLNDAIEVEGSMSLSNSTPRNAQPNIGERFISGDIDRTYNAKYFRDKYKGAHGGMASLSYGDEWGAIPNRDMWWSIWENETIQKETVVRPNLKLTVQFNPWLKWVTDGSYNYYYTRRESKIKDSGYANNSGGGSYSMSMSTQEQTNLNTNLIADYMINEDWRIGGFIRGEYYNNYVFGTSASTNGGFIVPNQYYINNSKEKVSGSGSISGTKTILSVAGQFTAAWRDQLFLEVTGRNDWSSALVYSDKHGNFSFFYPSFSVAWLAHETLNLPKAISFWKLRASIAQVGNDTEPYSINSAYKTKQVDHEKTSAYYMTIPDTVYDANIRPERKTSWEVGTDYRMFNNRLGLDLTYYKENTRDQIMNVTIPAASGVSHALINAGNIQNQGIELALNTTPIETKDFSWDVNFTWTRNWSKIVELSDLVASYIKLQGDPDYGNYRIGSVAKVGGTYGMLMSDKAPMIDKDVLDDDGNVVKKGSGKMVLGNFQKAYGTAFIRRSGEVEEVGNMVPDFLGSVNTSIRFKRFTLRASFDARFGGYVASYPSHYGTAYGYLATSLRGADKDHGGVSYTSRWDGLDYDDGIIPDGIFPTGTNIPQPSGDPYTVTTGQYETGETYQELIDKNVIDPSHASSWTYLTNSWSNGVIQDTWYTKLNYICFRDLTLGYAVPDRFANKLHLQGLNLQANAHNLGYLLNTMPNKENPESVRGTRAAEFRVRSLQGVTTYYTFTINLRF